MSGWLVVASCIMLTSCGEPRIFRYRYISLAQMPGIEVVQMAPVKLENLISGPTIPIEYLLSREQYSLRIKIDPKSYVTGATVKLSNSPDFRLVPQPRRGARPERPQSCGAYDPITPTADQFEFVWNKCSELVDQSEKVIAFDVVGRDRVIYPETLAFDLEKDGFYWILESY